MKQYIATLESIHRYSPSAPLGQGASARLEKEGADAHEKRVWRERCNADSNGFVFIPPMAFKEALADAGTYLGMKVKGRGATTYAKFIRAGVLVTEGISTGVAKNDVQGEWLFLNADGRKGGSTRVWRCMPFVESWRGDLGIHVVDETVTRDVLREHLVVAGMLVGVGRFRPQKGGFYGRFRVNELVEV